MAFWKQKYNQTEGFSLVEVMVSIAILGFVVVPMLTGLLFSYRLNQRSNEKLQAQLAVSNAVETIMAEGYKSVGNDYGNRFPNVSVTPTPLLDVNGNILYVGPAVRFTVSSVNFSDVSVTTYARPYIGGGT